ncbi:MAG: basal-body rod modification protein FlgD [Gammaproteobacteria bacterium]|nr:MAG: basal-body rod modification protein FlgD [Gammaproteobacteria bacterium]
MSIDTAVLDRLGLNRNTALDSARGRGAEDLGVQDFLTLMLAQIRNQDPFQPQPGGEFIAQLAQFGTVSGIEGLRAAFDRFSTQTGGAQVLQAAALLDRNVLVEGDTLLHEPGRPGKGVIALPQSTASLSVRILDEAGALVNRYELGPQSAGEFTFTWDGRGADGGVLPAGRYRLVAEALVDGRRTALDSYVEIPVTSVAFGGGVDRIELELADGRRVRLGEIRGVR